MWASASPEVVMCRELLRCNALRELIDLCQDGRLAGTRRDTLTVYRRLARADGCPQFVARPNRDLWLVQPHAP